MTIFFVLNLLRVPLHKKFEVDGEVKEGLYKCIESMVFDPNKQDEIHNKLLHFNESLGIFDLATILQSRSKILQVINYEVFKF